MTLLLRICTFCTFLSIILVLFFTENYATIIESFAPDGQLEYPNTVLFTIHLFALSGLGLAWMSYQYKEEIIATYNAPKLLEWAILSTLTIIATLYLFRNANEHLTQLYEEDSLFENLTALCSFITALILLSKIRKKFSLVVRGSLLLLGGLFIFFGLEEISYGQRLFGWDTPEYIMTINHQEETNLHNLFNPIFLPFYVFFNFMVVAGLLLAPILRKVKILTPFKMFIPNNVQIYFAGIFLFLATYSLLDSSGELTEEIVAISSIAYALGFPFRPENELVDS